MILESILARLQWRMRCLERDSELLRDCFIVSTTQMLRNGTHPGTNNTFKQIVHVGHFFGEGDAVGRGASFWV